MCIYIWIAHGSWNWPNIIVAIIHVMVIFMFRKMGGDGWWRMDGQQQQQQKNCGEYVEEEEAFM